MRRTRIIRFSVYTPVVIASLYALGAFTLFGRFSYGSVCSECGARRSSSQFLGFHTHTERATPLSSFLTRSGISESHEHNWLFIAGSGAGVRCAIGSGRHIAHLTDREESIRLLSALREYRGVAAARQALTNLLDPDLHFWRMHMLPRDDAFADQQSFESWHARVSESYEEHVEFTSEATKPVEPGDGRSPRTGGSYFSHTY